jgi:hypothetical protein
VGNEDDLYACWLLLNFSYWGTGASHSFGRCGSCVAGDACASDVCLLGCCVIWCSKMYISVNLSLNRVHAVGGDYFHTSVRLAKKRNSAD